VSEYTLYAHKQAAGRIMATYQFGRHGCTATRVFGEVYGDCSAEAQAHAERVSACWNVCAGIPTGALEAGVVVVPAETVHEYIEARTLMMAGQPGAMKRYSQADEQLWQALMSAFARFQQSGGCSS